MAGRAAGTFIVLGVGLLFALIGGGVGFFIGKPILDNAKASESWPSVPGKVIESELERRRNDGKTTYSAVIVYQYTVDGQQLECDDVWFGQYSTSDRSEINRIVRQYPVGQQVDVYYSPNDPATAVLQPGVTASSYLVFGIGMLFFGIGGLMIIGPLVKGVFLTAAMATAPADSFAGGATFNDQYSRFGDNPEDGLFPDDRRAGRPVRFDDDNQNHDDDAFPGIPG